MAVFGFQRDVEYNSRRDSGKKKKVVFTVTCLEKNWVGRSGYIYSIQTTEMHIFAVIMLHQHKFYVYKGKRKLKLLITCKNFVLFAL